MSPLDMVVQSRISAMDKTSTHGHTDTAGAWQATAIATRETDGSRPDAVARQQTSKAIVQNDSEVSPHRAEDGPDRGSNSTGYMSP